MSKIDQVSDELVNSFIDEQLSTAEKSELLEAISADEELSAKVCDAQRMKALVAHAYQHPPRSQQQGGHGVSAFLKYRHALAAGLILAVGMVGGWYGRVWWNPMDLQGSWKSVHYLQSSQFASKWIGQQKVVLHVGSSEPAKLKASLDQTEHMLNTYRQAGRDIKMELIVSGGGLDLLRADVTPYAERIKSMKQTYGNLAFIACGQTIERLRKKGVKVDLLPEAIPTPDSALDVVISRLQQGWTYVSI